MVMKVLGVSSSQILSSHVVEIYINGNVVTLVMDSSRFVTTFVTEH